MAAGRPNNFQTLNAAAEVRRLKPFIPAHWKLWEPSCGSGFLVDGFREEGYDVTGTDLETGFDFTDPLCPAPPFDMIVGNPPFDIKTKWLKRCFEIGKPFALILPIAALGEQKRVAMFKKYGIQIALPPERIEFLTPNGTEGGGWFYSAWFCHGLNLPSQIHCLD